MTIKMYQILSFQTFYEAVKEKKLPSKIAYKISLMVTKINEHTRFYYERMNQVIEEYAERDENGDFIYIDETSIKIKKENIHQCQMELNELQNLDVDLGETNLSINDLEGLDLTIEEMATLAPILQD